MGSPEKLLSAKKLEALDKKQRAAIKKEVIRLIQSSPEIRRILKAEVRSQMKPKSPRKAK
jgi:ABC-type Fe3+/spermidine/putrescine transport system ATPase subunit